MKKVSSTNLLIIALSFSLLVLSYTYFQTHRQVVINGVALLNKTSAEVVPFILKAVPGQGNIFIDIDTYKEVSFQSSFLMAKEFIQNYLKIPMAFYDYYVYLPQSGEIVSGQSAGLGITIGLLDLVNPFNANLQKYVFTGVILPYGVLGEVGGIEAKFNATEENHKILIHANPNFKKGKYFSNIFDVYKYLTGKELAKKKQITPPEWYYKIWAKISKELCDEAEKINKTSKEFRIAVTAMENRDYYAAASFCFVTDYKYFNSTNLTAAQVSQMIAELKEKLEEAKNRIRTLYDAEAYTAAEERLKMAENSLKKYLESENKSKEDLVYAYWRVISAEGWLEFVGKTEGPKPECNTDIAKEVELIYSIYFAPPYNESEINEYNCYFKVRDYIARVHYSALAAFNATVEGVEKVLPYLVDRFDLIGYTSYELSKYLENKTEKLYYLSRAIDFMHQFP